MPLVSEDSRPLSPEELLEYQKLKEEVERGEAEAERQKQFELGKSLPHTILSGVARGATLNYPLLESWLSGKSLDELNKEIVAQRAEHPIASTASEIAGGFLTPMPFAGAAKTLGVGLGRSVGQSALGGAVTGGLIGGLQGAIGNIPEKIHDTPTNRVINTIIGSGIGGALGGATSGAIQKWMNVRGEKAAQKLAQRESLELQKRIERESSKDAGIPVVDSEISRPPVQGADQMEMRLPEPSLKGLGEGEEGAIDFKKLLGIKSDENVPTPGKGVQIKQGGKTPGSLEELTTRNRQLKGAVFGDELFPREKELVDAVAVLGDELQGKPLPLHFERVSGTERAKEVKRMTEMPGPVARAMSESDAILKGELGGHAKKLASGLGAETESASSEASKAVQSFRADYLAKRDELSKPLEAIYGLRSVTGEATENMLFGLNTIGQELTGDNLVRRVVEKNGAVQLVLKPHRLISGLDPEIYGVVRKTVNELNALNREGKHLSIGDIGRIREGMRKAIDRSQPRDTQIIDLFRKRMLDEMENVAQEYGENAREVMRKWAINEKSIEKLENMLGGRLASDFKSRTVDAVPPEVIAKKIFQTSENTKVALETLGSERVRAIMGGALAEHLNLKQNATGFSGIQLKRFLDNNRHVLPEIMTPDELDKIRAISTIARLVPDQPPANTSGTATSLMDMVKNASESPVKAAKSAIFDYFKNQQQQDRFNQLLREAETKWSPVIDKAKAERAIQLERRRRMLEAAKKKGEE